MRCITFDRYESASWDGGFPLIFFSSFADFWFTSADFSVRNALRMPKLFGNALLVVQNIIYAPLKTILASPD